MAVIIELKSENAAKWWWGAGVHVIDTVLSPNLV